MSAYDLVMLAVLVAAILFGAWKGLAWQIASLAAIFVSYFVALSFREPVAAYIDAAPPWNTFAAMLILFLGTSLVIWIMFGFVRRSITKLELKTFDRQAGAILGAAKGALLCMVITMFAVTLLGARACDAICDSMAGGYIARGINQLTAIVPGEIHQVLAPHVERFNNAITDHIQQHPGEHQHFQVEGNLIPNAPDRQASNQIYEGSWQLFPAADGQPNSDALEGAANEIFKAALEAARDAVNDAPKR